MVTRRTVLGAGLVFASATCMAGSAAVGLTVPRRPDRPLIDALLVDDTIEMPRRMAVLIDAARGTLPVIGIALDAASQAGLRRLLNNSNAIVGVSSGATLFCMERIAWDHGFRLTGRTKECTADLDRDICRQAVTAYLGRTHRRATEPATAARTYRPSRADGTLHAWVMQKTRRPLLRQDRQEV